MDYHSIVVPISILLFSIATTTVFLILLALFFLCSFLISGSEVAFFSLTQKDLNVLKTRERPSFRRVVNLLENPKPLLGAMLIANSFCNIGLIIILNLLISNWLPGTDWWIFLIKVVGIAFLLVLFTEVMPKVWATNHKIWFAANASLFVEIFYSLLYGISKRMVRFNDGIETKLSSDKSTRSDDKELDEAIDMLPDEEATVEEKQILKGIRKFSDTDVRQVMRTRLDVSGVPFSASFDEVKQLLEELHYSRLPVFRTSLDDIAGMLHTKDLLPYLKESGSFDWHALLRTPYFVHETKNIEDLLQEFRTKRVHFAIVVDEFGGTSGIVTLEDIMEEIIGDIRDEFDEDELSAVKIDDNNYVFEGKLMINDALKSMNLPIDTFDAIRGDSDSVAGLVLEIAGEFPQPGQQFVNGDFIFTPLEMSKNRIDKVKITIQQSVQ